MKKIKSVAERQSDRAKIKETKENITKATTVAGLKIEVQKLAELLEEHIYS